MQTSSNIEIRIGQLLKRFSTKFRFDFPIAREPALDEVRLSLNRMKRTAGLKDDFFHGTPPPRARPRTRWPHAFGRSKSDGFSNG
jgi:hypothetical protein